MRSAAKRKKKTRREAPLAISERPCGSGSAWVENKLRFFKDCREIRRGKDKGSYEIKIPHASRGMRKLIVARWDIKDLPRKEKSNGAEKKPQTGSS